MKLFHEEIAADDEVVSLQDITNKIRRRLGEQPWKGFDGNIRKEWRKKSIQGNIRTKVETKENRTERKQDQRTEPRSEQEVRKKSEVMEK